MRLEFDAATARRQDESHRDLVVAWHTAAFALMGFNGKLPPLDKVLRLADARPQAMAEQHVMVQMLSAQYGIPLVKRH